MCATEKLGQGLAFVRRNHGFDVASALLAKPSGHFLSSHEKGLKDALTHSVSVPKMLSASDR